MVTGRMRLLAAAAGGVLVGLVAAYGAWSVLRAGGNPTYIRLGYDGLSPHYASEFQPIQHRAYRGFDAALVSGEEARERFAFAFAREVRERWRVVAVGDVMAHDSLQITAFTRRNVAGETAGGYGWILADAEPVIAEADLAIGNLETVVSHRFPRRGFPTFNADPLYLKALAGIGFDVMTTANNHILDLGADGLRDTETNLAANGMAFTGTAGAPRAGVLVEARSQEGGEPLAIGIVSYTDYVNGSTLDHFRRHEALAKVNYLCADRHWTFRAFVDRLAPGTCHTSEASFLADAEASIADLRAEGADYVAVFVHRLRAYGSFPDEAERRQAIALALRGADAVVATGSHSIMPVERIYTSDGEIDAAPGPRSREHLLVHSLGNFVSTQGGASAYGLVAAIDIGRDRDGRFAHAVTPHFARSALTIEEHREGDRSQKLEIYHLGMLDLDGFLTEARERLSEQ